MAENSRPIQTIPAGFLGMIDLKNTGKLPDELIGNVQPVSDMVGFWLRARREPLLSTGIIGLDGGFYVFTLATVPQQEWWYLHEATATCSGTAAQTGGMVFRTSDVAGVTFVGNDYQSDLINATVRRQTVTLQNRWMPPGSSLQLATTINDVPPGEILTFPIMITRCRT